MCTYDRLNTCSEYFVHRICSNGYTRRTSTKTVNKRARPMCTNEQRQRYIRMLTRKNDYPENGVDDPYPGERDGTRHHDNDERRDARNERMPTVHGDYEFSARFLVGRSNS